MHTLLPRNLPGNSPSKGGCSGRRLRAFGAARRGGIELLAGLGCSVCLAAALGASPAVALVPTLLCESIWPTDGLDCCGCAGRLMEVSLIVLRARLGVAFEACGQAVAMEAGHDHHPGRLRPQEKPDSNPRQHLNLLLPAAPCSLPRGMVAMADRSHSLSNPPSRCSVWCQPAVHSM